MMQEKQLFTPLAIKKIQFKNRIWVSPMCQYSSIDGHSNDWHIVHLGSRAVGGAGLVMMEATAVTPDGRISTDDMGIWSDDHIEGHKRLTHFIKNQGAISGIQIAHAGRKGSTSAPWHDAAHEMSNQWQTIAPSPIPFKPEGQVPREMTHDDIADVTQAFVFAAQRSLEAGFQLLELHMAHGYLMHQFLSPISNQRRDEYGGNLINRMRFPLEIAHAVRSVWPEDLPLFVRISATDWAGSADELNFKNPIPGAWGLCESITFCNKLKEIGVDLIDCSSGGTLPNAIIPTGPGYQIPFAEAIRREVNIMTAGVGIITEPFQAESILVERQADAIFLGREFLRNPYWPIHAAQSLGVEFQRPEQYGRA